MSVVATTAITRICACSHIDRATFAERISATRRCARGSSRKVFAFQVRARRVGLLASQDEVDGEGGFGAGGGAEGVGGGEAPGAGGFGCGGVEGGVAGGAGDGDRGGAAVGLDHGSEEDGAGLAAAEAFFGV